MLQLCPFCGHQLSKPLTDGMATCKHCSRVLDTCPFNRQLSAGWLVRKKHYESVEPLIREGITEEEATLALSLVMDEEMSPQEYYEALKSLGISTVYTAGVD